MNFVKRAYLYIIRKKVRTILLFSIILIMATLLIVCFSINSSSDMANANVRKALKCGFTVNAKTLENGLDKNIINQILNIEGITDSYNLRSYTVAEYRDTSNNKLKTRDDIGLKVYENSGRIVGARYSEKDNYFTDEGFKLISGKHITPDEKQVALIHEDFANKNNLSIGDYILLKNIEGNEIEVKVKIIGIFTSTRKSNSEEYMDTTNLFENIIFTDLNTGARLIYETDSENSQYGDFEVEAPEKLDNLIAEMKEIKNVNWDNCKITKNDSNYENTKESLEGLRRIVSTAIVIILIISVILIVLILNLWTKHRTNEMGILLSIGISKKNIIWQQIIEALMVSIPAFILCFVTSCITTKFIGSKLINDISNSIKITVNISDWLLVSGIGLLIILVSTIISIYQITKVKPRDIFSRID